MLFSEHRIPAMVQRKVLFLYVAFFCSIVTMLLSNTSLPEWPSSFNSLKQTDITSESTASDQRERLRTLRQGCAKVASRKFLAPSRFYVDDKHRLMYCFVPKVACTSLKRLMLVLSGLMDVDDIKSVPRDVIHEKNPLRKVEAFGDVQLSRHGFKGYLKFLFVRHPFERLVSAYYDKFVDNRTSRVYRKNIGTQIIRRYRSDASKESMEFGHDVMFPEFVSFVIDEWKSGRRKLDVHWRPMSDLCLPCTIQYDFVGKFESFDRDLSLLMKEINETKTMELVFGGQSEKPATSSILVHDAFSLLNNQQKYDLLLIYDSDFRIFNYQAPTFR